MDYTPRYRQPFTLEHAIQLDVPTITEEIARLKNSLEHLRRTQNELREFIISGSEDHDIMHATEDNELVIGSQEERIGMLNMALAQKGVSTNGHYDLSRRAQDPHPVTGPSNAETTQAMPRERAFTTHNLNDDDVQPSPPLQPSHRHLPPEDEDGGIHL